MRSVFLVAVGCQISLMLVSPASLESQVREGTGWPQRNSPFQIATVGRSGMPVVPTYEGWVRNADGTTTLSFGYFNMNREEVIDIPLGPDNFIEPSQFDGMQPTHFMPAPTDRGRQNRHESVFAVTVPADYVGDVVWTLRYKGKTYTSPGRAVHESYAMDDLVSLTSAPVAASLRFDPSGPETRGRRGITVGPLSAQVGTPLAISVWVDPDPQTAVRRGEVRGAAAERRTKSTVTWYKHQGPGEVTFAPAETVVDTEEGAEEVRTMVTFGEPGEYMLRVTAIESLASLVQHCCWTNAYIRLNVVP